MIQVPDTISLSGNIKDIIVSAADDIAFQLYEDTTVLVDEIYSPDADGKVTIKLSDLVTSFLTVSVPTGSGDVTEQTGAVKTLRAVVGAEETTFTVVKSGVDATVDPSVWLKANWLTWQPQTKYVKYTDPQWLSYFAVVDVNVKLKAYFIDNTTETITFASLTAGSVYSLNVLFSSIRAKFTNQPTYFDIWTEDTGGTRLSYIQRIVLENIPYEYNDIFVFENTLGGIDTARLTGRLTEMDGFAYDQAEFDDEAWNYDLDYSKGAEKNTGYIEDADTRKWTKELLTSVQVYHLVEGELRKIAISNNDQKADPAELNSFTFSFLYSKKTRYLNLSRADNPSDPIQIVAPNATLFFLAPRLSDFPNADVNSELILPAQSPFTEKWKQFSTGAFRAAILNDVAGMISGASSGGGTVDPSTVWSKTELVAQGQYLYVNSKKISAGYADDAAHATIADDADKLGGIFAAEYFNTANANLPTVPWEVQSAVSASQAINLGQMGDASLNINGASLAVNGSNVYHVANANLPTVNWTMLDGTVHGYLQSPDYVSGFTGAGWRVAPSGDGEFDSLSVRKSLTVHELLVAKERSINGGLVTSVANGVAKSVSGDNVTMKEDTTSFVVGDRVRCQDWNNSGRYYEAEVTAVAGNVITLGNYIGTDRPQEDDNLVQWGHKTDPTRQSFLYQTARNGAYFSVLSGVNSSDLSGKEVIRMGDLSGVVSPTFGNLSGYGIRVLNSGYFENVKVSGEIHVTGGNAETQSGAQAKVDSVQIDSRNLLRNTMYSSSVAGYSKTNGWILTPGTLNRQNLTTNPIKSSGYYSISFWYKVENFSTAFNLNANLNDSAFPLILISGNTGWTFYSASRNIATLIGRYGFIDFEGVPSGTTVTLSDITIVRATKPLQTYTPAPEDQNAYINDVALNAQSAAQTYAYEQANLAQVTASAYADNIVSDEEARAIADAQAKADAALATAKSYADNSTSTLQTSLGAMAYEQAVGLAKLDSTLIEGGFFKNSLINTGAIYISNAQVTGLGALALLNGLSYTDVGADASGSAASAQSTAISTAATDATTKANNAQSAAESYADSAVSNLSGTLGDLAYQSLVGQAMLDDTLMVGGYIKSTLLDVQAIKISGGLASQTEAQDYAAAAADAVQVGGTNIARNGDFSNSSSYWSVSSSSSFDIVTDSFYGKMAHFNLVNGQATSNQVMANLEHGTYTYSAVVKASDFGLVTGIGFVFYYDDSTYTDYTWEGHQWFDLGNGYKKVITTGTSDGLKTLTSIAIRMYTHPNVTVEFWVGKIKFERGNKATDWSPNPKDQTGYVDGVISNLSNSLGQLAYQNAVSSAMLDDSLMIGGYLKNSLIDTGAIYISHANVTGLGQLAVLDGLSYSDVGADPSGSASAAQTAAQSYAESQASAAQSAAISAAAIDATAKVESIEIGGSNLIKRSEDLSINFSQYAGSGVPTSKTLNAGTAPDGSNGAIRLVGGCRFSKCVDRNGTYTFSFWVKKYPGSSTTSIETDICDQGSKDISISDTWQKVTNTVSVTNYTSSLYNFIDIGYNNLYDILVYQPKLERGNKATDWSPNPNDIETYADGLYNTLATNKQDAVVNGKTLIINGYVNTNFIEAGSIVASMIAAGTISGDKIAAGTITASLIAAGTITGDKIAAGTISASNIDATNLHVSAANVDGTLTASQINFNGATGSNVNLSGTITATSGSFTNATFKSSTGTKRIEISSSDNELKFYDGNVLKMRVGSDVYNSADGISIESGAYIFLKDGATFVNQGNAIFSDSVYGVGTINGALMLDFLMRPKTTTAANATNGSLFIQNGNLMWKDTIGGVHTIVTGS